MESIRGYFKALKWRSLIVAFSAILLGLLFILTPQASADVICYVAGILLLASGIAAVISYLASGRLFGSYALVSGIVLLVCGVFCPGRWAEELRRSYHEEVCGGLNYARTADGTTDVCLVKLLNELSEDEYRHAERLMALLERSLGRQGNC